MFIPSSHCVEWKSLKLLLHLATAAHLGHVSVWDSCMVGLLGNSGRAEGRGTGLCPEVSGLALGHWSWGKWGVSWGTEWGFWSGWLILSHQLILSSPNIKGKEQMPWNQNVEFSDFLICEHFNRFGSWFTHECNTIWHSSSHIWALYIFFKYSDNYWNNFIFTVTVFSRYAYTHFSGT